MKGIRLDCKAAAGDVVIAGRDVRVERPERVKSRLHRDKLCLVQPLELLGHVFLDHVHGQLAHWPMRHALGSTWVKLFTFNSRKNSR